MKSYVHPLSSSANAVTWQNFEEKKLCERKDSVPSPLFSCKKCQILLSPTFWVFTRIAQKWTSGKQFPKAILYREGMHFASVSQTSGISAKVDAAQVSNCRLSLRNSSCCRYTMIEVKLLAKMIKTEQNEPVSGASATMTISFPKVGRKDIWNHNGSSKVSAQLYCTIYGRNKGPFGDRQPLHGASSNCCAWKVYFLLFFIPFKDAECAN